MVELYTKPMQNAKLHQARKQVKCAVKNAKDFCWEKMCAEAEQKDAFQAWHAMKTIQQDSVATIQKHANRSSLK